VKEKDIKKGLVFKYYPSFGVRDNWDLDWVLCRITKIVKKRRSPLPADIYVKNLAIYIKGIGEHPSYRAESREIIFAHVSRFIYWYSKGAIVVPNSNGFLKTLRKFNELKAQEKAVQLNG
jgi:hypothetical protein